MDSENEVFWILPTTARLRQPMARSGRFWQGRLPKTTTAFPSRRYSACLRRPHNSRRHDVKMFCTSCAWTKGGPFRRAAPLQVVEVRIFILIYRYIYIC